MSSSISVLSKFPFLPSCSKDSSLAGECQVLWRKIVKNGVIRISYYVVIWAEKLYDIAVFSNYFYYVFYDYE